MTTEENSHEQHFEEGSEAPPPGVHAMAIVRWLLLAAMAVAALWSIVTYAQPPHEHAAEQKPKFHCPMHPQITSDQPGECPICHMNLEPLAPDKPAPGAPSAVPVPPHVDHEMHPMPRGSADPSASAAPNLPPGTTPITLSFDRIQAIGVRTALVARGESREALRVNAVVEVPDEARAEVHFRSAGFVEAIRVKELGVKVKAGELLASIYSPEVFQAEQELIAARSWATLTDKLVDGKAPVASPYDAARQRLGLLGVGAGAVDQVAQTGKPFRAVGVSSPIGGYVVAKNVVLGSRVEPDTKLFEIADLSRVYVIANVFPQELKQLHVGDSATFTTPALPDRTFAAKIDLVYPEVDLATRTARVRFHVDNPELLLRPGQFGTAELASAAHEVLTVPLDAVIDTGRATYAFVAEEGGKFTPRAIELGDQLGDRFVVLGGLSEGERVVSGATFLIDSESRLQATLTAAPAASAGAAPAGFCEREFDRDKFRDKYTECKKCEAHRGMGTMEDECRAAIAKPWK